VALTLDTMLLLIKVKWSVLRVLGVCTAAGLIAALAGISGLGI